MSLLSYDNGISNISSGSVPLQNIVTTSLRDSKQYLLAAVRYACPEAGEILVYLGLDFAES
jgi:hypothetical protein